MAFTVMAHVVMAHVVTAYVAMAYVVMAYMPALGARGARPRAATRCWWRTCRRSSCSSSRRSPKNSPHRHHSTLPPARTQAISSAITRYCGDHTAIHTPWAHTHIPDVYSYGLYSYGLYRYGLYRYGLCRFDREISLGIPDEAARARILRVMCAKLKLADELDVAEIARRTPCSSPM